MKLTLPVAALCFTGVVQAQATKDYDFHLDNGAEVIYQTYSQVDLKDPALNFGTARVAGNAIERNMTDGKTLSWLGFRLQIERVPGDPIRFRLSMGSQGGWGFFGWAAPPREIQNGDRVLLDVLQEPGTGRKVFDTLQVGIGVGMHAMPVAKTIPQTPGAGVAIHLQNPELLAGKTSLGKNVSELAAPAVNVFVAGKGLFRFSAKPEAGYRMEAIAEGNTLMFVIGGDRYDVQCSSPIIDGAGAWYLWVKHEAADRAPGFWTLDLTAH